MNKTKFGKWDIEIQNNDEKKVSILKDDERLILLDGENYYLLYAQIKEDSILFQNVDNDILLSISASENKVTINFKDEE